MRDEETRALRSQVELLTSENQMLQRDRAELTAQMYGRDPTLRSENHGLFPGFGWLGRGFGNLLSGSASPKPPAPPRALEFGPTPPLAPTSGFGFGQVPMEASGPHPTTVPLRPVPLSPPASAPAASVTAGPPRDLMPDLPSDSIPRPRVLNFENAVGVSPPAVTPPEPPQPSSAQDPMNVVLTGMAQLQGVIADLASGPKAGNKPEVIKPGVVALQELPPAGPEACLLFSDWIHSTRPALADVSDSSEELWELVLQESKAWYARHLKLDAIARLTDKPTPSSDVLQPRWSRVSRRIESVILAASPVSVREELSSARVSGLLQVVCRLYTIYAPGGLTEREIGLRQLLEPSPGTSIRDTVELLRKWKRWGARMLELGGTMPDSALQLKALEKMTKAVLQANPEVSFRVSLTRAALQIDTCPDDTKIGQLHAQILAELEALGHRAPRDDKGRDNPGPGTPKIKGVEQNDASPKNPKVKSGAKQPLVPKDGGGNDASSPGGIPCSFYTSASGCKKGSDCTFVHNWQAIPASERPGRCRKCGAKGHRSTECRAGLKAEEKAKFKSSAPPPKPPNPKASDSRAQNSSGSTKDLSQQQIKSMLADAAAILQQAAPNPSVGGPATVTAVPISPSPQPPSSTGGAPTSPTNQVTPGTPVTLASLNAQIESLRSLAREYEIKMIWTEPEANRATVDSDPGVKALLDSGATHAVVPFTTDMTGLERVSVTLAGDQKEEWFKTGGGTLVVPPPSGNVAGGSQSQTILPLGSLVQTLGCSVSWSKKKGLKVTHPKLGPLKTGVARNSCPYVQEDQALTLIGELETARLRDFEQSVQAMEAELKQLASPCDPTAALQRFVSTGLRMDLLKAVFAQPYLQEVPEALKVSLCEELPGLTEGDGWKLLKSLPLSRANRRALHASKRWVVNLGAGPYQAQDPIRQWCEENHLYYLPVDIIAPGGKGWDLTSQKGVWAVLLWAAAKGRIVAVMVLAAPPHLAYVLRSLRSSYASGCMGHSRPRLCDLQGRFDGNPRYDPMVPGLGC